MKLLIIKRDKIGDMLLMTPMLEHLRAARPDCEIHVLANDYNAWVIEGNPRIDRLWIYPRLRHDGRARWGALWEQLSQLWRLRRERFDVAIAAGGVVSPRAVERAQRIGARRTIGYAAPGRQNGLSDALELTPALHEVDANMRLLEPLGIARPECNPWPRYELPTHWREFGARWIAERGLAPRGFVVIGVNARRERCKPTPTQIARWAERFKSEWNLDTVLMWQPGARNNRLYPGDDEWVQPLLSDTPAYLHPFADASGILPALGVVWHAATSIFPDGGIAHMASMSAGGVLAFFADCEPLTHPDKWRPYAPHADHLEAAKTVAELTDEQVFAKVRPNLVRARAPQESAL